MVLHCALSLEILLIIVGDIDGEDERKFFCSALFATAAICKIMKHEAPTQ